MKINSQKTKAVTQYIQSHWRTLTCTHKDIYDAAIDPKYPAPQDERWPVYISRKENITALNTRLRDEMSRKDFARIEIKQLPLNIRNISQHGLLYLPHPYVVPGGRFNELYGWDSYFIVLGLLHDKHIRLAINMVDNLIYEIEHYGKILNANRSYYLTRSNPPLLTQMILAIYKATHNKVWLKSTLPAIEKCYQLWATPPHCVESIGLSRFYARGTTQPPEVEPEYYDKIKEYYETHIIKAYNVNKFYNSKTKQLTPLFFRADRTVRESGFDLCNKYGPFGADITHYLPVSLNALLYMMEDETGKIHEILGQTSKALTWHKRAKKRADLINKYLWEPDLGFYFDYNFITKRSRPYIYATTFYPLWAGLATADQADHLMYNLPALESNGGILSSAYHTGMQWDAPLGWAPHQFITVEGLLNYGYHEASHRVATKYINMLNDDFARTKHLFEKYDVRRQTSNMEHSIRYGYVTNVKGFGWTNGVYLDLLESLKK